MNEDALPVVDIEKCVACNDCVEICPKDLFVLMPLSQKLVVQCKSLLEGDEALARCSVACNACGRCALDAMPGVIEMKNNLPVINYELNEITSAAATMRCPTGAIVWLDSQKQFAPKSKSTLPVGKVDAQTFDEATYYQ